MTDLERWEKFKKKYPTTKKQILEQVLKERERYRKRMEKDKTLPAAFFREIIDAADTLYKKIESSVIFEVLPDWWVYNFTISYDRLALSILHVAEIEINDNAEVTGWIQDSGFDLIYLIPRPLTVTEYANLYSVEEGTVRQWIRRGKVRTAQKLGNEWRIPALTMPPTRGYDMAQYIWHEELRDLPEEYAYLNDYKLATFYQDSVDKKKYHVIFVSKKTTGHDDLDNNLTMTLDAKDVQKIELFFISHPQIRYACSF